MVCNSLPSVGATFTKNTEHNTSAIGGVSELKIPNFNSQKKSKTAPIKNRYIRFCLHFYEL